MTSLSEIKVEIIEKKVPKEKRYEMAKDALKKVGHRASRRAAG